MKFIKKDKLISVGCEDVVIDSVFIKNHWEIRKILKDIWDVLKGRKGMIVYDKQA